MRCPRCTREMLPLFTSLVCDYCDSPVNEDDFARGYVVYTGKHAFDGRPVYVFRSRVDAARWRAANELHECPIREVLSAQPFTWRESKGAKGANETIVVANRPYELYPDHRFPPGPNRAFLRRRSRRRAA